MQYIYSLGIFSFFMLIFGLYKWYNIIKHIGKVLVASNVAENCALKTVYAKVKE